MSARISLKGTTFGRLKVIADGPTHTSRTGAVSGTSVCLCVCGNTITVSNGSLKTSNTRSCGCLHRDSTMARFVTHGHTRGYHYSGTYRSWQDMKVRCLNPNSPVWKYYGGRGITVCDRWMEFINFLSDLGERPIGYTLERVDNSKGYEPLNCKWATRKEQVRNTRRNRIFTVDGLTGCIAELCERYNINWNTVAGRLKSGWPPDRAFTQPVGAACAVGGTLR